MLSIIFCVISFGYCEHKKTDINKIEFESLQKAIDKDVKIIINPFSSAAEIFDKYKYQWSKEQVTKIFNFSMQLHNDQLLSSALAIKCLETGKLSKEQINYGLNLSIRTNSKGCLLDPHFARNIIQKVKLTNRQLKKIYNSAVRKNINGHFMSEILVTAVLKTKKLPNQFIDSEWKRSIQHFACIHSDGGGYSFSYLQDEELALLILANSELTLEQLCKGFESATQLHCMIKGNRMVSEQLAIAILKSGRLTDKYIKDGLEKTLDCIGYMGDFGAPDLLKALMECGNLKNEQFVEIWSRSTDYNRLGEIVDEDCAIKILKMRKLEDKDILVACKNLLEGKICSSSGNLLKEILLIKNNEKYLIPDDELRLSIVNNNKNCNFKTIIESELKKRESIL